MEGRAVGGEPELALALISPPPGACALIELRSIQASPDGEISKSSLPTSWPLMVMRSLPLSAEKTEGAPAGAVALAEATRAGMDWRRATG